MKKQFRDFESEREFVRSLGLQSRKDWQDYYKSGKKPDDIPAIPNRTYKNEFKGMGDWLGTGTIASRYRIYRPFAEARKFVRALNLKGTKEWKEYCASGNKPDDIPSNANLTYKKEFKGYGDWLGTGRIAYQDRIYRPYQEARKFVRKLGLKNQKDWYEYCASGNKPNDIPADPWITYKEWKKK